MPCGHVEQHPQSRRRAQRGDDRDRARVPVRVGNSAGDASAPAAARLTPRPDPSRPDRALSGTAVYVVDGDGVRSVRGHIHDAHVRAGASQVRIRGFCSRRAALSTVYGLLAGTSAFGVVEIIWTLLAVERYRTRPPKRDHAGPVPHSASESALPEIIRCSTRPGSRLRAPAPARGWCDSRIPRLARGLCPPWRQSRRSAGRRPGR